MAREFAERLEGGDGVELVELTSWSSLGSLLAEALEATNLDASSSLLDSLIRALYPPSMQQ
jgi:hypothetical protein